MAGLPSTFSRFDWGEAEAAAAQRLIDLAIDEDFGAAGDLTSQLLIDPEARGTVRIVARKSGILCGLPIVPLVFERLDALVTVEGRRGDGDELARGDVVAELSGPVVSLLGGERTALNFLTRLSGIATLTQQFVNAVKGTRAQILDTRKTDPGWRVLEKYAVRCGGGVNHRMGLFDAVLIKDNHLAAWGRMPHRDAASAVETARAGAGNGIPVIVEVDTLTQLENVLPARPDIVLLDNMSLEELRTAVSIRDSVGADVLLEASGGITLETVAGVAATGVDRISAGSLTHSAVALDLGFDWVD